uniref:60S ribosomal export protein NMD3 n=1 Tax=Macrostomum lignano TaxID=282301 RepID=A0A1I8F8T6_9PLAT
PLSRLMREAKDLAAPTELYYAQPLEDNLFEWHFTIRGPGGVYHGRVLIPGDYPMKPPNIILLTPNGRFERSIKRSHIGLSPGDLATGLVDSYGFVSFGWVSDTALCPTHGLAQSRPGISAGRARRLARQSRDWRCPICCPTPDSPSLESLLNPLSDASAKETEEARSLAKEISIAGEKPKESDDQQQQQQEAASTLSSFCASEYLGADAAAANSTTAGALQPPMSFQEWLVRIKGFSEARARQLVESSETSQQQQQPQTANRPNPQVGGFYSILREEWTTIVALIGLALAIAAILARRMLLADAGGYDTADANAWYRRITGLPPSPESKELLALCLKRIRGLNKVTLGCYLLLITSPPGWTRRVRVASRTRSVASGSVSPSKAEVLTAPSLSQTCEIEFTLQSHQCDHCNRSAARTIGELWCS